MIPLLFCSSSCRRALGPHSSNRQGNQQRQFDCRAQPPWTEGEIVHDYSLQPDNDNDSSPSKPSVQPLIADMLMKEVRGRGLMIGVEFGPPKSLRLKASWNLLETASKGLFCQLITVPLFKDHKILTQVSGHGSHTIKLLPSLTITEEDCNWIETAFDTVIASSHKVPGAIWSLGKTLVDNAVRKSV